MHDSLIFGHLAAGLLDVISCDKKSSKWQFFKYVSLTEFENNIV